MCFNRGYKVTSYHKALEVLLPCGFALGGAVVVLAAGRLSVEGTISCGKCR